MLYGTDFETVHGRRPRRRKSKDNPYTLFMREERYFVSFKDGEGNYAEAELTKEQYLLFDQFEREDKKEANKRERHYEQSEQYEESLFRREARVEESVEFTVLARMDAETLQRGIRSLPALQRRRLCMYYFEGLTYEEIAAREGCTKMPVKRSIEAAIEKLKKYF